MTNAIIKFIDATGAERQEAIDASKGVTFVDDAGKEKVISLLKGVKVTKDINEMDIDELRKEIRNSNSVYYKTKKKYDAATDEEKAKIKETMDAQQERAEAATKLFDEKFPGQSKTIGAKGRTAAPKSNKADEVMSIIKSIESAAIPQEQKDAALDKLNTLLASLTKKSKAKEEVKEEANEEANEESMPSDIEAARPGRFR